MARSVWLVIASGASPQKMLLVTDSLEGTGSGSPGPRTGASTRMAPPVTFAWLWLTAQLMRAMLLPRPTRSPPPQVAVFPTNMQLATVGLAPPSPIDNPPPRTLAPLPRKRQLAIVGLALPPMNIPPPSPNIPGAIFPWKMQRAIVGLELLTIIP